MVRCYQINTVFDMEYNQVVKLEGYDRISQYFCCPGDYKIHDDIDGEEYGINGNEFEYYFLNIEDS